MDAYLDGVRIFYHSVGSENKHPLILLHGGPGLDHTELHPWLDALSDTFRLIFVDMRGQGRSQRVDPSTLSLDIFAEDVTALARTLGVSSYAVLGHSYGAFVALAHAIRYDAASHYILSSGTASFAKSGPEIDENLATFEPVTLREQVTLSWAREPNARTAEDFADILRMQMPFHFARVDSEGYQRYIAHEDRAIYAPEVLAYFASHGYAIEYEDQLSAITRPVLIITGMYDRTCTPRAARDLHAGIRASELVLLPDAGHMSFIEQPQQFCAAVRDFYVRHPSGVAAERSSR